MSWFAGVYQRLRELLQPSRVAAELDDELRDHFHASSSNNSVRLSRPQRRAVTPASVLDRPMWRERRPLTIAPDNSPESSCVISVLPAAVFDAIQG